MIVVWLNPELLHADFLHREVKRKIINMDKKPCEICGFNETTDYHHEEQNKIVVLCPNHHALITRGIKTYQQLLQENLLPI